MREEGRDEEGVVFDLGKGCRGMGWYIERIERGGGEREVDGCEFEKWEGVEFVYGGYVEEVVDGG